MEKKQDLIKKMDSVENKIDTMNVDINDIKKDIKDIKNAPAKTEEQHYHYLGFWGWLAITSVASSLATAALGIAKAVTAKND